MTIDEFFDIVKEHDFKCRTHYGGPISSCAECPLKPACDSNDILYLQNGGKSKNAFVLPNSAGLAKNRHDFIIRQYKLNNKKKWFKKLDDIIDGKPE